MGEGTPNGVDVNFPGGAIHTRGVMSLALVLVALALGTLVYVDVVMLHADHTRIIDLGEAMLDAHEAQICLALPEPSRPDKLCSRLILQVLRRHERSAAH